MRQNGFGAQKDELLTKAKFSNWLCEEKK